MLDRRAYLQAIASMYVAPLAWGQRADGVRRGSDVWPTESARLIVPFPAGGASDILAKHLTHSFERTTKQKLRLEYQGGQGGLQGANVVAKSAPDGKTLLIAGSYLPVMRALAINDDFDFIEELRPLALIAAVPQVIVVNPSRMRSRTVTEWLSELGRKPVRYRMATAGVGSSSHISAEILKHHEALQFEVVHYRGAGPALQDLLIGSVDMMIDGVVSCLPHIRSGTLKPLMVTGSQRVNVLRDVPCAQEMGIPALNCVTWYGLFAPRQLSDSTAQLIVDVFQRIGRDSVLAANLDSMGIQWGGVYGEAFNSMVKQETMDWAQRLKSMSLRIAF